MAEVTKPIKVGNYWTNLVDTATGEGVTYEVRIMDLDGTTPLNDAKCDEVLYRKTPGGEYVIDTEYINTSMVNVKRFGAVGDQTTDDTAAIQAALDSAPRKAVIFFPVGVYVITRTLNIPVNKELVFLGSQKNTQTPVGWGPRYNGISAILWQGENAMDDAAIKNTDSSFICVFRYMSLYNGTERDDVDGIQCQDFRGGVMEYTTIVGFRRNVYIGGNAWYSLFNRCFFLQGIEDNFHLVGLANGLTMSDCRLSNSSGNGAYFVNASSDITFNNCYFEENSLYALNFENSGNINIFGGHFESNGEDIEPTEEKACIKWQRYTNGIRGTTLNVVGASIFIHSGINFIAAWGGVFTQAGRLRLKMESCHINAGASEYGNQTYAISPINGENNITASFEGNTAVSQVDNDLYRPRVCADSVSLRQMSIINDGLYPLLSNPSVSHEGVHSNSIRTSSIYLPPDGIMGNEMGASLSSGSVDPEGEKSARPGSLYIRYPSSVKAQKKIYIKQTGTGNTGWQLLKTSLVEELPSGDLDATEDGSIYSVVGSSVNNAPVAGDGFVFTWLDSDSNKARQMWVGRRGEVYTRGGSNSVNNRYVDGWVQLLRSLSGPTANRPTIGVSLGDVYFDTDLSHPVWYDGADWVNAVPDIPDATTSVKGIVNQSTASADTAGPISVAFDQAEVQAILTELRDLKAKMRTAGLLAT